MEFQEIIIAGIVIIVAALILSFIFAPANEAHNTNIQILNKGDFSTNSTLYIKLTDDTQSSLSNRTVHVQITDENGTVVYKRDVETHATGVAMCELANVSEGEYTINLTFDGDENYTASSVSKKVNVKGEPVEDEIDNSTLDDDAIAEITSQQQSSPRYSPPSSSSSSSSSSDDSSETYYDADGNPTLPTFDEDGNPVPSTGDE